MNVHRMELLARDNYDTWKIHMQAILIKNGLWKHVSGERPKPTGEAAIEAWKNEDEKARSEIILCIAPSELKQIKNCETSGKLWDRLKEIYESTGPARKSTLLKQLILQKLEDGGDVEMHLRKFCDTVDKLAEMDIQIHPDMQATMMLYSLPASFENFRCAIESRDELPAPQNLRIKIVEEVEARVNNHAGGSAGAMQATAPMKKKYADNLGTNLPAVEVTHHMPTTA